MTMLMWINGRHYRAMPLGVLMSAYLGGSLYIYIFAAFIGSFELAITFAAIYLGGLCTVILNWAALELLEGRE